MRFSLYLLFFLFANVSFSQIKFTLTEQEYQKLHDKARLLINSNVDSSFIYANKIEKSNNNLHKSFAYGIKSYLYQLSNNLKKSDYYYVKAFEIFNKVPNTKEKIKLNAYLLNYGGLIDWKRGKLANALIKYEQGKKLSEKEKDVIQIIKFGYNIATVYAQSGNYRLAIKEDRELDKLIERSRFIISEEQFNNNKSTINTNLGSFYESINYEENNKVALDSAAFFYNNALLFSNSFKLNKINAQYGLGNILCLKKEYKKAINVYQNLFLDLKESKLDIDVHNILYNLGISYYNNKEYDYALLYFSKTDSVYNKTKANYSLFLESNYYQAKIYEIKKEPKKSLKHATLYLDNFEENENKVNKEKKNINSVLVYKNLKNEMLRINNKYKKEVLINTLSMWFIGFVLVGLFGLLVSNSFKKKKTEAKIKNLLLEFELLSANKLNPNQIRSDEEEKELLSIINHKTNSPLNLDQEKEDDIIKNLNKLIIKNEFLKEGFTQQYVANKIKTNTTYLSYVVNKNFNKTFSDYVNELKINFAINQMITNPTYRKYSTQAIAESVGFKNAISFTKSFNKRTGVTPVQFIKGLN